jgi:hypothetical protein
VVELACASTPRASASLGCCGRCMRSLLSCGWGTPGGQHATWNPTRRVIQLTSAASDDGPPARERASAGAATYRMSAASMRSHVGERFLY